MRFGAMFLAASLALVACATPYQPKGFAGGFKEQWVSERLVQIDFEGNGFTSSDEAGEMALLRAAETAIEHGWKYFKILGDYDTTSRAYTPATSSTTTGQVNADGSFTARTRTNGFTSIKPGSRIFASLTNTKLFNDPSQYDAQEVVARLGPRYK